MSKKLLPVVPAVVGHQALQTVARRDDLSHRTHRAIRMDRFADVMAANPYRSRITRECLS